MGFVSKIVTGTDLCLRTSSYPCIISSTSNQFIYLPRKLFTMSFCNTQKYTNFLTVRKELVRVLDFFQLWPSEISIVQAKSEFLRVVTTNTSILCVLTSCSLSEILKETDAMVVLPFPIHLRIFPP